jgi:ribosome biogenesis GTPase
MIEDVLKGLEELGWDSFFLKHFQTLKISDSVPARVISESKGSFQVYSQYGELTAKISGWSRKSVSSRWRLGSYSATSR